VLTDRVGSWRRGESWRRHLAFTLLPVALLGAVAARLVERGSAVDRERAVELVERFDAPLSDVVGWMRFGTVAERLREEGVADRPSSWPRMAVG
jgi:hypothetical protein